MYTYECVFFAMIKKSLLSASLYVDTCEDSGVVAQGPVRRLDAWKFITNIIHRGRGAPACVTSQVSSGTLHPDTCMHLLLFADFMKTYVLYDKMLIGFIYVLLPPQHFISVPVRVERCRNCCGPCKFRYQSRS